MNDRLAEKNSLRIIKLPRLVDLRGNLTFIEEEEHIPFKIKRVYWIYDVPGGQSRGGHAFKIQQEIIIALSGSFDVKVDNGNSTQVFSLNRSFVGLYIPNGLWRKMNNFSTNSLALVLTSTYFREHDYIRQYKSYLEWLKK